MMPIVWPYLGDPVVKWWWARVAWCSGEPDATGADMPTAIVDANKSLGWMGSLSSVSFPNKLEQTRGSGERLCLGL